MGLYKREQYFNVIAAVLFLIGAVFMLVWTFGNQEWAVWVGFGFAGAAALLYILIQIQRLQFNKKYTAKEVPDADTNAAADSASVNTAAEAAETEKDVTANDDDASDPQL